MLHCKTYVELLDFHAAGIPHRKVPNCCLVPEVPLEHLHGTDSLLISIILRVHAAEWKHRVYTKHQQMELISGSAKEIRARRMDYADAIQHFRALMLPAPNLPTAPTPAAEPEEEPEHDRSMPVDDIVTPMDRMTLTSPRAHPSGGGGVVPARGDHPRQPSLLSHFSSLGGATRLSLARSPL